MKKQILIPTDFSSTAFNAIQYAFEIFKETECVFHIFHVYYIVASSKGNPMFPVPDENEYRAARESISSEMDTLRKNIATVSNNEKHQLVFEFEYGFLVDQLNEKVENEKIDLVMMGTRGVTDDIKVAYGRNAIDVMEKVRTCPIIAIPARVRFKPKGEIVYPTDFKGKYGAEEMRTFRNVAKISNSPIRILHIGNENSLNSNQQENKKLLENEFQPLDVSFHWADNISVIEGLLQFVQQRESAMICFINRKHWFFGNIFSKPLIKCLGIHSRVPLFALHTK